MKALVVRLSSIGDVVHTLPALAALHRAGWEAGWVVEPPARVLVEHNPLVAQAVVAPSRKAFGWARAISAIAALRRTRYEAALDFQGLWKSAAWVRMSGARRRVGWERSARREPGSELLLGETVTRLAHGHVIDKNLALLGPLGLDPVVTFGPGEEALAERVVAASRGTARASFPTTLLDFIELARRARLVVAADTGPLHLACAVGTPVVALFGPTDPARNGPFAPDDVVVRRVPVCAPCYSRGCRRHAGVMEEIALAEVRAAVDRRLALARA